MISDWLAGRVADATSQSSVTKADLWQSLYADAEVPVTSTRV
jgi:hypothetical protein